VRRSAGLPGLPKAGLLLALLFLGLGAAPAGGDEISSWFAADPRARAYQAAQAEIEDLANAARLHNVPLGPILDKLREGASKGADTERLLAALRETIDRLARARGIFEQAGASGSGEDVQALSLLLLRGLPEEVARGLVAYGRQAGRGMPAIRAACGAVTGLLGVEALENRDALKVGALLLGSRLPLPAYGSLASLYLKASAAGMEDSEILNDVIIGTLESGGGVVAMDEKINRGQAAKGQAAKAEAGSRANPSQAGPKKEPPGQSRPEKEKKK
jgi:hypothetical protein